MPGQNVADRKSPSGPEATSGGVQSVFGRVGAVVALLGDYLSSLITNDSSVGGATVSDALEDLSNLQGDVSGPHDANTVGSFHDSTAAQVDFGDFATAAQNQLVLRELGNGNLRVATQAEAQAIVGGGASYADFIIEDMASLEAQFPANGSLEHHLNVNGVYAFKEFTLDVGHSILVSTTTNAVLMGPGPNSPIVGERSSQPILRVSSDNVTLKDIGFQNTSGVSSSSAISTSSDDLRMTNVFAEGESAGLRITGGNVYADLCEFTGDAAGVNINGGDELTFHQCVFRNATSGISFTFSCDSLCVVGGRSQSCTTAILIQSGGPTSLVVNAMKFLSGSFGIRRTGGTVSRATISNTYSVSVGVAIDWVASLPTNGMAIVGNVWGAFAPINGFDELSTDVNMKANVNSSGLLPETPIV